MVRRNADCFSILYYTNYPICYSDGVAWVKVDAVILHFITYFPYIILSVIALSVICVGMLFRSRNVEIQTLMITVIVTLYIVTYKLVSLLMEDILNIWILPYMHNGY